MGAEVKVKNINEPKRTCPSIVSYKEKNKFYKELFRFQLNNERPRAIKFSGEKGSVGESKPAL